MPSGASAAAPISRECAGYGRASGRARGGRFRRGVPVAVADDATANSAIVLAAETASDAALNQLPAMFGAPILDSHTCASEHAEGAALHAGGRGASRWRKTRAQKTCAPSPIRRPISMHPMKGPFDARARCAAGGRRGIGETCEARRASAGDAALSAAMRPPNSRSVSVERHRAISMSDVARTLSIVTRARVPLEGAEDTELVAFRPADGGPGALRASSIGKPRRARAHAHPFGMLHRRSSGLAQVRLRAAAARRHRRDRQGRRRRRALSARRKAAASA